MSDLTDDLKTVKSLMDDECSHVFEVACLGICIESVEKLEKQNKTILKKFAEKSLDAINLYETCDRLEKENELFRATLNDLLKNYTVAGEDAYNLIENALK